MEPAGLWMVGLFLLSCYIPAAVGGGDEPAGRGRLLLGFKEARGNASFQCVPSGPCLPCFYSEKNDEKYRCSETGYRVPLKCVEIQDDPKEVTSDKTQKRPSSNKAPKVKSERKQLLTTVTNVKWRKLLDDLSISKDGKQSYITYRSCVPVEGEEKLSVLGFEAIMVFLLLVCGPMLYMKRKNIAIMPGAVRIPTNSPRF